MAWIARSRAKKSLFRIDSLSSLGGMAKGGRRAERGEWEPSLKRLAGVATINRAPAEIVAEIFRIVANRCRNAAIYSIGLTESFALFQFKLNAS